MRANLFLVILMLSTTQGICQDQNRRFALGVSYVPSINWLSFTDEAKAVISPIVNLEPRLSHSFGASGKYNITSKLSSSAGIYWMDYGYNFDVVAVDFPTNVPLAYSLGQYKTRVTYLDVPVQLALTVAKSGNTNFYVKGGVAISWLQGRRIKLYTDDGATEQEGPRVLTLSETLYSLRIGFGLHKFERALSVDVYPNLRRTLNRYNSYNSVTTGDDEKVSLYALALDIIIWYNL